METFGVFQAELSRSQAEVARVTQEMERRQAQMSRSSSDQQRFQVEIDRLRIEVEKIKDKYDRAQVRFLTRTAHTHTKQKQLPVCIGSNRLVGGSFFEKIKDGAHYFAIA